MGQITTLNKKRSKFIFYSIRERLAIQELASFMNYNLHYLSDHNGYDSYDAIFTNENQIRCVSEIKIRKHFSTDFEGWILEKRKYDALMNNEIGLLVPKLKLIPLYILFLFDGCYVWDLNKVTPNFTTENLRHESVGDDMDMVDKERMHLYLKDATKINYILDYDKLNVYAKVVFKNLYPNNRRDVINL